LGDVFYIIHGQWFGVVAFLKDLLSDNCFESFVGEEVLCFGGSVSGKSQQEHPEQLGEGQG
jgi:hypothetical protein